MDANSRRRRRPKYENELVRITVPLDADWIPALDAYRLELPGLPTRTEAVRRVLGQIFGGKSGEGGGGPGQGEVKVAPRVERLVPRLVR